MATTIKKSMKKIAIICLLIILLFPLTTKARGLVPCGGPGEKVCSACDLLVLFENVLHFALGIAFSIVVIFAVIGGFRWIFSGGKEANIEAGHKTLANALIGLAIILCSWLIINTVFYAMAEIGSSELSQQLKSNWWQLECSSEGGGEGGGEEGGGGEGGGGEGGGEEGGGEEGGGEEGGGGEQIPYYYNDCRAGCNDPFNTYSCNSYTILINPEEKDKYDQYYANQCKTKEDCKPKSCVACFYSDNAGSSDLCEKYDFYVPKINSCDFASRIDGLHNLSSKTVSNINECCSGCDYCYQRY